jgi:hypothetical protein
MKSPDVVVHGTSSEGDAEKIKSEGFKVQEGRATVSGDLIYAFDWATNQERRRGSKSEAEVAEEETGRMVIMGVPEDKSIDYATHTSIEVDEESQEVTGYSSKYVSGRRQLAVYAEGDVKEKRGKIEKTKQELKELTEGFFSFLRGHGVDPERVKSKEDLVEAIKLFELTQKVEILKKAEEFERQRTEKRKEAELETSLAPENVLMSVVPTKQLGEKLDELSVQIRNLETVDLARFTEEVSVLIEQNEKNFLSSGINVREVVGNLLSTTFETEVVNMMRSLAGDVARARGFTIYNRGREEKIEKPVDVGQLREKIEKLKKVVESDDFNTGMEKLNRYVKMSVQRLAKEMGKVEPPTEMSDVAES